MSVVMLGGLMLKQIVPADNWIGLVLSVASAAAVASIINLFFIFNRFEREALYSAIRGKFAR